MISFTSNKNSVEINKNIDKNVNKGNQSNTIKVKVKRTDANDKNDNKYDMTGRTFGDYTVVGQDGVDGTHHKLWKCVCNKCGESFKTTSYELTRGRKNTKCTKNKVNDDCVIACDNDGDFVDEDNISATTCSSNNVNTQARALPLDTIDPENPVVSTDESHLVYHREACYDLFSIPFYYRVAYCLPTNLSTYGTTASKLGVVCKESIKWLKYEKDYFDVERKAGSIATDGNLFILCVNEERKVPESENIKKCIYELAERCAYDMVEYLAMPRICCGHNHQNWEDMKKLIIDTFVEAYTEIKNYEAEHSYGDDGAFELVPINITFCYQ